MLCTGKSSQLKNGRAFQGLGIAGDGMEIGMQVRVPLLSIVFLLEGISRLSLDLESSFLLSLKPLAMYLK